MTNKTFSTNMVAMKRLFPLALIGLGVLFILGTAVYWVLIQEIQHPTAAPLPESVGDLQLTQSAFAGEAITEFTSLHHNDFPLTSGAVGMYGPDHAATLWVAGAPIELIAYRLLMAMRDRIANSSGRSPFSPIGERQVGNRTVYELEGMGQKHFYFQSGKLVVWLAADPQISETLLNHTLEFYP